MSRRQSLLSLASVLVVAALSAVSLPAQSSDPPGVNVAELVREAYRNGARMSARIFEYTWTDTRNYVEVGRNGKARTHPEQVYEVFPNRVSGRLLLRRLVKENGVPVSAERAAKEQKRLAEEIEEDERDAEKENRRLAAKHAQAPPPGDACVPTGYATAYGANGGLIAFSISDFLCAGEFSNPRRGEVNGREAIVLDFRPRANYRAPAKERDPIAKLSGRVWIDARDRVVSRLEAWPTASAEASGGDGPKASAAPSITYEQVRLPDGTWMHSSSRIDTVAHPAIFNRVTIRFQEVFTDYRRFTSEVEGYKLNKPE